VSRVARAALALALVACGDDSTGSDGGPADAADATECLTCQDAGLCDPNEPPIPAGGCATGEFVCWNEDPGFNGCTLNTFCSTAPGETCFVCNPAVPDGGCSPGESVCSYADSRVYCTHATFCATPQAYVYDCLDAGDDADADAGDAHGS